VPEQDSEPSRSRPDHSGVGGRDGVSRRGRRAVTAGVLALVVVVLVGALLLGRPFGRSSGDQGPVTAGAPGVITGTHNPSTGASTTPSSSAGSAQPSPSGSATAAQPSPSGSATAAQPSPSAGPQPLPSVTAPGDEADGSPGGAALPVPPEAVPQQGNGRISVLTVPGPASTATGRVVRYTVEMEGGLGVDAAQVARTVRSVLLDARGWQQEDHVRFVNVSRAQAERGAAVDIRVTLASPALTDRLCRPLRTLSQVSCWNGSRSVLNLRRWLLGDDSYGTDVARYRVYQVNHEVGHGLGHGHRSCPAPGRRAPVMVQQTLSLQGCKAWPHPTGA
jgi:hypothetical protein